MSHLPTARTCYNTLELPRYESEDILKKKLLQAINETEGFGFA